jgi:mRNA interferase RelE/StbE
MTTITFLPQAVQDLDNLDRSVVKLVLSKLEILETNPLAGTPLGRELTGFRKLVVGDRTWRIVYRIVDDNEIEVCEVWAVGPRADSEIYRVVTARLATMTGNPAAVAVAAVVAGLGLRSTFTPPERPPQPPPAWLVQSLTRVAGMDERTVLAMDPDEAQAAWEHYITAPQQD